MTIEATWGVAQKNARSERVCGDAYVAAEHNGTTLWSIIDGAGHGPRAHAVAEEAAGFIRSLAFQQEVDHILVALHRYLRGRRGAAVSLLKLDAETSRMEYAGVGNVEVRSHGPKRIQPVSTPGILGRALRRVKTFTYDVQPGIFIAMFSDGISSRFSVTGYAQLPPAEAAERILKDHHKAIDDGTCIVIRLTEPAR